MRMVLVIAAVLGLAAPILAADDALAEVNAARAARGLPPYLPDPALAAAASAAADHRATYLIQGHTANDFAFLPAGVSADAAGCGALHPSWGWGTCCTYESHTYAGAAVSYGRDGRRYMHIFVRSRGGPATVVVNPAPSTPALKTEPPKAEPKKEPAPIVFPTASASVTTCANGSCGTVSRTRVRLFTR